MHRAQDQLDAACRRDSIAQHCISNPKARVTTAHAEQTTVAAFRPWRGLSVHIPWALAPPVSRSGPSLTSTKLGGGCPARCRTNCGFEKTTANFGGDSRSIGLKNDFFKRLLRAHLSFVQVGMPGAALLSNLLACAAWGTGPRACSIAVRARPTGPSERTRPSQPPLCVRQAEPTRSRRRESAEKCQPPA
jgi:hypothetical protein